MRLIVHGSWFRAISLITVYALLFTCLGCEAFVRKFTRKPKKDNQPKQEMVLAPEEYQRPQISQEEEYRNYFIYWRSWQDELINALSSGGNHKKLMESVSEALRNIDSLRALLNGQKQKELDVYIVQLQELMVSIEKDTYGSSSGSNRASAERIKRNILKDFSYRNIKDCLI